MWVMWQGLSKLYRRYLVNSIILSNNIVTILGPKYCPLRSSTGGNWFNVLQFKCCWNGAAAIGFGTDFQILRHKSTQTPGNAQIVKLNSFQWPISYYAAAELQASLSNCIQFVQYHIFTDATGRNQDNEVFLQTRDCKRGRSHNKRRR